MRRLFRRSKTEIAKTKAIRDRINVLIAKATLNHDEAWFTAEQLEKTEKECIDRSISDCLKGDNNHA